MTDDLVTAGVFGDQTQAVVVRNYLTDAGIPAFLLDEYMSQGLFVVGGASGGVRIEVPRSRLEEAVRLISDRRPEHSEPINWSEVDVGKPEPDGTEGNVEPVTSPLDLPATSEPAIVPTEPSDLTLREQRANRIVRGALIGIFAWPVYFLAIYRLFQIANSKERLRPEYHRKANIATLILFSPFLLAVSLACGVPLAQLLNR